MCSSWLCPFNFITCNYGFLLCWSTAFEHRVSSRATVSSNQQPVFICLVCHLKSRVLSVTDVSIKVFQVNSQSDVISCCQTVKIVVSKPELAVQISKTVFCRIPIKIEVNRAVQTSLKNCPTSTVRGHVTQHLYWFAAIWIDRVYATWCESIFKPAVTTFWVCKILSGFFFYTLLNWALKSVILTARLSRVATVTVTFEAFALAVRDTNFFVIAGKRFILTRSLFWRYAWIILFCDYFA